MKLLFLDIDGVLNSEKYSVWFVTTEAGKQFKRDGGHHFVDPNAVKRIVDFCTENDVKIVISSSWRYGCVDDTIEYLKGFRDLLPIIPFIVGITPRLKYTRVRGEEIEWFIKNRNMPPIEPYIRHYSYDYFFGKKREDFRYCIIDDDTDMLDNQKEQFVHIDNYYGITDEDINKMLLCFEK